MKYTSLILLTAALCSCGHYVMPDGVKITPFLQDVAYEKTPTTTRLVISTSPVVTDIVHEVGEKATVEGQAGFAGDVVKGLRSVGTKAIK